MKNNLEYYPHYSDSHQHPKFKLLRVKYGWAGEGKFWALNNMIAKAENTVLDISKKYNKAVIADELQFNLEELEEYLNFLSDECNLVIYRDGFLTTDIVKNTFSEVAKERERSREKRQKRVKTESTADVPRNFEEKPRYIEEKPRDFITKESKGKESKVNESKEEEKKSFFYVGSEKVFDVSEFLHEKFRFQIDNWKRVFPNVNFEESSGQFMAEKAFLTFTDENHFRNSFAKFIKQIDEQREKEKKYGTQSNSLNRSANKPNPTEFKGNTKFGSL